MSTKFALLMAVAVTAILQSAAVLDVGGDYGRAWLSNFLAFNEPPVKSDQKQDLWSWGGAPLGKSLVDGALVEDLNETQRVNVTANWLGDTVITRGPTYLNSSTYRGLADGSVPMSPLWLSDDPWIRAQQLGQTVRTPLGY